MSVVLVVSGCGGGAESSGNAPLVPNLVGLVTPSSATVAVTAGVTMDAAGFSTFVPDSGSVVVYVSNSNGSDANNGLSPQTAVKTIAKGASLVRNGQYDFLLLMRGDVWRDQTLARFKSGRDASHPIVIASYGTSTLRPRLESVAPFIDHGGASLSYVAVMGLEFFTYVNDPGNPAFTGAGEGGLRYVGNGTDLLLEDNKFTYGELILQSYGSGNYRNVKIRRNVIALAYHVNTCGQNQAYRPSGTYTSHVEGLLFEGNVYDHNGWNERVSTACATMFNHNLYLNANDLVVRDNLITRGSSMGIKTVADSAGDSQRLLFENNFIYDGEIGISVGGNTPGPYRYTDVTIRGNVFSEIGKSNPTSRGLSWALGISDHDRSLVENNYFLQQPWFTNSYGISMDSPTMRDVTIRGNTFYNINGSALIANAQAAWSNVQVSNNRFLSPTSNACMVNHTGSFSAITYSNNQYAGSGKFCLETQSKTQAQWSAASGETNAQQFTGTFVDSARTLATYAATQGYVSVDAFLAAAAQQSRFNWQPSLTAAAVNDYIKAGFATR